MDIWEAEEEEESQTMMQEAAEETCYKTGLLSIGEWWYWNLKSLRIQTIQSFHFLGWRGRRWGGGGGGGRGGTQSSHWKSSQSHVTGFKTLARSSFASKYTKTINLQVFIYPPPLPFAAQWSFVSTRGADAEWQIFPEGFSLRSVSSTPMQNTTTNRGKKIRNIQFVSSNS